MFLGSHRRAVGVFFFAVFFAGFFSLAHAELSPNCSVGSGLMALWHMNGDATDTVGDHNGILNGVSFVAAGKFSQAASFSHLLNSYIEIPDPGLGENVSSFTVSLWFKTTTATLDSNRGLIAYVPQLNMEPFQMTITKTGAFLGGGKIQFDVQNSLGQTARVQSVAPHSNTSWHNLIGVYNASLVSLYLDGTFQGNGIPALVPPTRSISQPLRIGYDSGGNSMDGLIDDVAIWHRALSASEILQVVADTNCSSGGGNDSNSDGSNSQKGVEKYCGDALCSKEIKESAVNCARDCPAVCGDHACTHRENAANCPVDCVVGCGNDICEKDQNENSFNCPEDCGQSEAEVTLNQIILAKEIIPEPPEIIQKRLAALGFYPPIEKIQANAQNIGLYRTVAYQRISYSKYAKPVIVTTVTVQLTNKTSNYFTNIQLVDEIPRLLTTNLNDVYSPNQASKLEKNNALLFTVNVLNPFERKTVNYTETKTVSYTIPDHQVTLAEAEAFLNPIVEDAQFASAETASTMGCHSAADCPFKNCQEPRCIQQECYQLNQSPGTACGPGQECTPSLQCEEKNRSIYNKPLSLLDLPTAILTIIIIVLAFWIITEYAKEN